MPEVDPTATAAEDVEVVAKGGEVGALSLREMDQTLGGVTARFEVIHDGCSNGVIRSLDPDPTGDAIALVPPIRFRPTSAVRESFFSVSTRTRRTSPGRAPSSGRSVEAKERSASLDDGAHGLAFFGGGASLT